MRNILAIVAAALLSVGFFSAQVNAQSCNCPDCQAARQIYTQPYYGSQVVYQQPRQMTLFQKMMELERRKNAWLRRTFLGK